MKRLIIWSNHRFSPSQQQRLERAASQHQLALEPGASSAPQLREADVAFGQPPVADILASSRLAWVQLSSAGYGSYDQPEIRRAFAAAGRVLTKSSVVYASPCAEHVLAFMLAWSRKLPLAWDVQRNSRVWPQGELRQKSRLLEDQRVVLVGFGSIGARLAELLEPFTSHVTGIRRKRSGDEGIQVMTFEDPALSALLGEADHVVNLLPGVGATERYFDAQRFSQLRRGAIFYNVGRGSTVDQAALCECLRAGHLGAALLDVTEPEPLPPDHELWHAPNCIITPHSAGGHHDEGDRLVDHFIANLQRFERGEQLLDRAF